MSLDKKIIAYSLLDETIKQFKEITNYLSNMVGSALDCVLESPFSREASKHSHKLYVKYKNLLIEKLRNF